MRIFGLDPGVAIVGYGVLDFFDSAPPVVCDYGIVQTSAKTAFEARLAAIYEDINSLFSAHKPDLVAIEKLFFYKMGNTISVAQARGVVLLCAAQHGVPYVEFSPPQVKLALAGDGRADKRAIQEAVQRELGLIAVPKPDDAADALAIALTGWFHRLPPAAREAVPAYSASVKGAGLRSEGAGLPSAL
nr:crossover junction endodeoxyribonuclease RuvC [Gloeobacter morelensis]